MNVTHEGAQTKKLVEPVPFDKLDRSQYEKSMKFGKFAVHIAEIPRGSSRILTAPDFDFTKAWYKRVVIHHHRRTGVTFCIDIQSRQMILILQKM